MTEDQVKDTLFDDEPEYITLEFDDGKVAWYAFSELEQLEHAYCITIHKAQR